MCYKRGETRLAFGDDALGLWKYFPELDGLCKQETSLISRICGILCRVRSFDDSKVRDFLAQTYGALKDHLRSYGRKNSGRSVNSVDQLICDICDTATKLLSSGDIAQNEPIYIEDIGVFDIESSFQSNFMANMGILIPRQEAVMSVLPYILACYAINRSTNKLDPFRRFKEGEAKRGSNCSTGWYDVFYQYQPSDEDVAPSDTNRKRSINHLAGYLTEIPLEKLSQKHRFSSLLNFKGMGHVSLQNNVSRKDFQQEGMLCKQSLESWELYQQFSAFCQACYEKTDKCLHLRPNLTLSTALFARLWNWDYDFSLVDQKSVKSLSWGDIENDTLSDEIKDVLFLNIDTSNEMTNIRNIVHRKKVLSFTYDIKLAASAQFSI